MISSEYNNYVYLEILKLLKEKNIDSPRKYAFGLMSEMCYANFGSSIVVHRDGTLGKCTLCTNNDEIKKMPHFVGNIKNGRFNIIEEQLDKWTTIPEELWENKGCYECIAFPICAGSSCPLSRIQENNPYLNCLAMKEYLDELVIYDFEFNNRGKNYE